MAILFFIPKLQFFKSLDKISVYDILINNFKVDISQNLKPEYCIPVKKYFEEVSFYYDISNFNQKTIHRTSSWSNSIILLILLFNLLKCLFYIFWNENDQLIRLYGGNLEQYFGYNILFFAIPEVGVTLFPIVIFCLLQYSPINQLNWLTILNTIEGKQSFVSRKIFMVKSAKNLIRFSFILISFSSSITQLTPIITFLIFLFIPSINLTLKQIILYVFPWALVDGIWCLFICTNYFVSLMIIIICYYYELRLDQLDIYMNLRLKSKQFKIINQHISKMFVEYTEIINEMSYFNKFSSKIIFYLLLFCSSTQAFLIYNMIYVNIDWFLYLMYVLFSGNVCSVIIIILMRTIRIASKFQRNKRNLVKLSLVKNLTVKNRIKVSLKYLYQRIIVSFF